MDELRERIDSALRFTPERMEKVITNCHFKPWFVCELGFVYILEEFEGDAKKKTFVFADMSQGTKSYFDQVHLARLLLEQTGQEYDPNDLPLTPVRMKAYNRSSEKPRLLFFFDLPDRSRWMFDGADLKQVYPALPQNAVVSPDGKKAVYEDEGDLYLLELPSMALHRLTSGGTPDRGYGTAYQGSSGTIADKLKGRKRPTGVRWSPDSKRFFTYLLDYTGVLDYTLVQSVPEGPKAVRPVVHTYKYALPGDEHVAQAEFYLYDLEDMRLKKLDVPRTNLSFGAPINGEMSMLEWSESGKYAACYTMNRGCTKADIYRLDPVTGKSAFLFSETSPTFVFFDHHRILNAGAEKARFAAKTFVINENTGRLYWLSERDGQFDIFETDMDTGLQVKLTDTDCCVRQLLWLDQEKNILYYSASGKEPNVNIYQRYIYRLDLDSREITLLSREKGDHNAFFPPEGHYYCDVISAYDESPLNKVLDITDGTELGIASQSDISRLTDMGFTFPIPFCEKGADGDDVYGVMFLPHNFDPKVKYPVTEYYYGGNQTTRAPQNWAEVQETLGFTPCFSAMGFVTVIIDGRGTPLRGKKWHDYGYNNMGDCAGLKDHAAVLEALCQHYSFLDRDRIGVWGHSGGGFATLHCLVDHPELYKVGVSTGGNHSQEIYSAEWSERYMGPFDRDLWERQNAEYNVANLQGKLLLIHGELDDNVHPASTLRVVDALIKADKDFDMLIMPNFHHALRESDYYRRKVLEYFARNL